MLKPGSMRMLIPLEEAPEEPGGVRTACPPRQESQPIPKTLGSGSQWFIVWGEQPYVAGQLPLG